MLVSEMNRTIVAGVSQGCQLRAKRSNPLKVEARIGRLSRKARARHAPRNDNHQIVAEWWIPVLSVHPFHWKGVGRDADPYQGKLRVDALILTAMGKNETVSKVVRCEKVVARHPTGSSNPFPKSCCMAAGINCWFSFA
jgi:hypothetical protein